MDGGSTEAWERERERERERAMMLIVVLDGLCMMQPTELYMAALNIIYMPPFSRLSVYLHMEEGNDAFCNVIIPILYNHPLY